MSHESTRLKKSTSDWLNSGSALIVRVKNAIFVLPGNAEAQVTSGGILKRLLIAYFISSISAKISKSVHVCQSHSKPTVGRFLRHGV